MKITWEFIENSPAENGFETLILKKNEKINWNWIDIKFLWFSIPSELSKSNSFMPKIKGQYQNFNLMRVC
jgi:hypothetical protein